MDRDTRHRIQRATQAARALLEREYGEQLEGTFDIRLDGTTASEPGGHLSASRTEAPSVVAADLGHDVMDDAMVEAAAYVVEKAPERGAQ